MPKQVRRGYIQILLSPDLVHKASAVLEAERRSFCNYATHLVEHQIKEDYERLRRSGDIKEIAEAAE